MTWWSHFICVSSNICVLFLYRLLKSRRTWPLPAKWQENQIQLSSGIGKWHTLTYKCMHIPSHTHTHKCTQVMNMHTHTHTHTHRVENNIKQNGVKYWYHSYANLDTMSSSYICPHYHGHPVSSLLKNSNETQIYCLDLHLIIVYYTTLVSASLITNSLFITEITQNYNSHLRLKCQRRLMYVLWLLLELRRKCLESTSVLPRILLEKQNIKLRSQ